ncbi:hypothetical protein EFL87_11445 [Weissella confusa]|nr:hypothetical protein [Weissella confusa]
MGFIASGSLKSLRKIFHSRFMNRYSLIRLDKPFITWILYYNNTRIQAKLNGHSPVEYRQMAV